MLQLKASLIEISTYYVVFSLVKVLVSALQELFTQFTLQGATLVREVAAFLN